MAEQARHGVDRRRQERQTGRLVWVEMAVGCYRHVQTVYSSPVGNSRVDPQMLVVDHLLGQEHARNLVGIPQFLEIGKRVEVDESEDRQPAQPRSLQRRWLGRVRERTIRMRQGLCCRVHRRPGRCSTSKLG